MTDTNATPGPAGSPPDLEAIAAIVAQHSDEIGGLHRRIDELEGELGAKLKAATLESVSSAPDELGDPNAPPRAQEGVAATQPGHAGPGTGDGPATPAAPSAEG